MYCETTYPTNQSILATRTDVNATTTGTTTTRTMSQLGNSHNHDQSNGGGARDTRDENGRRRSTKSKRLQEKEEANGNLLQVVVAAKEPSITETKAKNLVSKVECIKAARQHHNNNEGSKHHHHEKDKDPYLGHHYNKKHIESLDEEEEEEEEESHHHGHGPDAAERRRRSHTLLVEGDHSTSHSADQMDGSNYTFGVAASVATAPKESPAISEKRAKKLVSRVECIKTSRQHTTNKSLLPAMKKNKENEHPEITMKDESDCHSAAAELRRRCHTMLLVDAADVSASTISDDMDGSSLGVLPSGKEPPISEAKTKSLVSRVESIKTARQQRKTRKPSTDDKDRAADRDESNKGNSTLEKLSNFKEHGHKPVESSNGKRDRKKHNTTEKSPDAHKDKPRHSSKTVRRSKSLTSSEGATSHHNHHHHHKPEHSKRAGRRSISVCTADDNHGHKAAIARVRQHKTHDGTMTSAASTIKRENLFTKVDDINSKQQEVEDEMESSGAAQKNKSSSLPQVDDGENQEGIHEPVEHSRKPTTHRSSKVQQDAVDCSGFSKVATSEKSRRTGRRSVALNSPTTSGGSRETAEKSRRVGRRTSGVVDSEKPERSRRQGVRSSLDFADNSCAEDSIKESPRKEQQQHRRRSHSNHQSGTVEESAEHSTRRPRHKSLADSSSEVPSKRLGRRTSWNDAGGKGQSFRVRRHNSHDGTMERTRSKLSPSKTQRRQSSRAKPHGAIREHCTSLQQRRNHNGGKAAHDNTKRAHHGLQRTISRRNTLDDIGLRQLQHGLALQDRCVKEEEEEQKHLEEMAQQMKKLNQELEEERKRQQEAEEQEQQAKAAAAALAANENRDTFGGIAASWGFAAMTSANNNPTEGGAGTYNQMAHAMGQTARQALTGVLGFPTSIAHTQESMAEGEDMDDDGEGGKQQARTPMPKAPAGDGTVGSSWTANWTAFPSTA